MYTQPVHIIGGGLAALALGQCLRRKGIAAIIYDKQISPPRNAYGITLQSWAWRYLARLIQIDESIFRSRVAVDGRNGGMGRVDTEPHSNFLDSDGGGLRAHRGRLESLLREGLDIQTGRSLKIVTADPQGVSLVFENGQSISAKAIVGADGMHSQLRKILAPKSQLRILPFVVFNGKRRVSKDEFRERFALYFQGANVIRGQQNGVHLELSVTDHRDHEVDVSYTYSRPARPNDPLHKPDRASSAATNTPEEFFEELEALRGLGPPFFEVFQATEVRKDRILHWLMRTMLLDTSTLLQLANQGVALIGDMVHATPILSGDGANQAILDAKVLAESIATYGFDDIAGFYGNRNRSWKKAVEEGERRLEVMHSPSYASTYYRPEQSPLDAR